MATDLQERSNLLRIDPATGAAYATASTSLAMMDIAAAPDGRLFGITDAHLVRIDPATGRSELVGDGTGFSDLNALAADPDGILYAATRGGRLITISHSTGRGALRGDYGQWLSSSGDLAFAVDGTLYATVDDGNHHDTLMRIDSDTGAATPVGSTGFSEVFGLTFAPDGTLYGSADADRRDSPVLIRIDPRTGAGTLVGELGTAGGVAGLTPGAAASGSPQHAPADSRPRASQLPVLEVQGGIVAEDNGSGGATAEFIVTLSEPTELTVTVPYETADWFATAGVDYAAVSGTLIFCVGETERTIRVPIFADDEEELDETIKLQLGQPVHASSGWFLPGEVTIRNAKVIEFGGRRRATYVDADNDTVTLSLRGPGSGRVTLVGYGPQDAARIELRNTDARSTFTAATLAGWHYALGERAGAITTVGDVIVPGPLRSFAAKTALLGGTFAAGRAVRSVLLHDVTEGTLAVASGIGSLSLNHITRGTILAGIDVGPNRRLGGGDDAIAAAAFGRITVHGDVLDSYIAAGIDPRNGAVGDEDDEILTGGRIGPVVVNGTANVGSRFLCSQFTKRPQIGRRPVDVVTDERFALGS
jgi:hypothetical protein